MIDARLLVVLWLAQVQAGTTVALALAVRPWVAMGDVYLPFGRGFSQDIDPVTLWTLPERFGLRRGSPEAAELIALFGQQQGLVHALLARSVPSEAREGGAAPVATLSEGECDLLARTSRRIATLTGATVAPDTRATP
ncbi:MAG: hypothetical protein ACFBWO_07115 [Paracoccaceae bacterium]